MDTLKRIALVRFLTVVLKNGGHHACLRVQKFENR
jgi:hypothetical protein